MRTKDRRKSQGITVDNSLCRKGKEDPYYFIKEMFTIITCSQQQKLTGLRSHPYYYRYMLYCVPCWWELGGRFREYLGQRTSPVCLTTSSEVCVVKYLRCGMSSMCKDFPFRWDNYLIYIYIIIITMVIRVHYRISLCSDISLERFHPDSTYQLQLFNTGSQALEISFFCPLLMSNC